MLPTGTINLLWMIDVIEDRVRYINRVWSIMECYTDSKIKYNGNWKSNGNPKFKFLFQVYSHTVLRAK